MKNRDIAALLLVAALAIAASTMTGQPSHQLPTPAAAAKIAPETSTTARITPPYQNLPSRLAADNALPSPPPEETKQRPQILLEIVTPDGTTTEQVEIKTDDDLCDNLIEAKAEGGLHSLTIDDTWLTTFGSRYVREIDGYSNNWAVTVNGTKPEGCSLYKPKSGDHVVWKFGAK